MKLGHTKSITRKTKCIWLLVYVDKGLITRKVFHVRTGVIGGYGRKALGVMLRFEELDAWKWRICALSLRAFKGFIECCHRTEAK
jgi:hypothetical protein